MPRVFEAQSVLWLNTVGHPQEDWLGVDASQSVFCVVDGVTRTSGKDGYPNPSPAAVVAGLCGELALEAVSMLLKNSVKVSDGVVGGIMVWINQAVWQHNRASGWWQANDYAERDLPGAVMSLAFIAKGRLWWSFIGDCGVAHISGSTQEWWETPDEVKPARKNFPELSENASGEEKRQRQRIIRKNFRNKPFGVGAGKAGYGVFTGEVNANEYIRIGSRPYSPGDRLLVFSDGMRELLQVPDVRECLNGGDMRGLKELVSWFVVAQPDTHNDDKSLIYVTL